jgi:hypothetical protein
LRGTLLPAKDAFPGVVSPVTKVSVLEAIRKISQYNPADTISAVFMEKMAVPEAIQVLSRLIVEL